MIKGINFRIHPIQREKGDKISVVTNNMIQTSESSPIINIE